MKRLYRSEKEKMMAGICGGLAEYWEVDPTIIRLGVVFLAIVTGVVPVVVVYILGMMIIPVRPAGL